MNFSFYIAKRYLFTKSSNNAINYITIIATIGIVLGSAALFIVLSGFAGLKDFTLQFTSIIDPDLKAQPATGKYMVLTEAETRKLSTLKTVSAHSKIIEERVFVAYETKNYPNAFIKGVDENYQTVTAIDSVIAYGNWLTSKSNQVVTGMGISNTLSIGVLDYGKKLNLYVPKPGKGQITSLKEAYNSFHAINVGIFDVNETLNDTYIYTPIDMARALLEVPKNNYSAIEFKLHPNATEAEARNEILGVLGNKVTLKNKAQLNDALYKMLNTENLAVYLIFTLVLIIALFNVIGSLIMMILDKKANLKTLYSTGATLKSIQRIFFYQGSLMSVLGGVLGLAIGYIIVRLQIAFALVMITPSLPYPMIVKWENLILVFLTISCLGIIASKVASSRISKALIEVQ
ncbi:MAG: ABC transporter permease [Algicola sp.]|nr:ABC transporter permease [Algicola sp.]